jgi:hypothetical protein
MAIADEACKAPEACKEVQTCGSENCCSHCGRHCGCEKSCKIVCEMKNVKKTVWVVHCGEVCTMLPGCPLSGHCCDKNCKECNQFPCKECEANGGKCNACASLENRNYNTPKCGRVRESKTLEKKEITCKVPTYKCVVVYSCPQCNQEKGEAPAPATPAPTPTKAADASQSHTSHQALVAPMPPAIGS